MCRFLAAHSHLKCRTVSSASILKCLFDAALILYKETLKASLSRSLSQSAPEVLAQKPYSKAVDCWSIGVISYIL